MFLLCSYPFAISGASGMCGHAADARGLLRRIFDSRPPLVPDMFSTALHTDDYIWAMMMSEFDPPGVEAKLDDTPGWDMIARPRLQSSPPRLPPSPVRSALLKAAFLLP
ncbi:hypothetical protein EZH22_18795 [Xanthobacter dioxanivorans]|uniref:Uncharacterized protein n=1 Tax=Xanthobacter dioxanivorans TaxID=2528964 RepID=A0A974PKF8_9HYPH|nr:hypothetical protein [Xanthobacter dioxanivorans]QRG05159.1 hypothetical protein EZH22_18795 [Xanthobacter dioxanivorans]